MRMMTMMSREYRRVKTRTLLRCIRRCINRLLLRLKKAMLAIIKEMLRAFFLQLKYGRTAVDTAYSFHLEGAQEVYKQITTATRVASEKALAESKRLEPPQLPPGVDRSQYILFGNRYLHLDEVEGHFLTIGVTGSGKTLLLHASLAHTLSVPGRKIMFDPAGDLLPILHGLNIPYKYFNISTTSGAGWEIAKDAKELLKLRQLAAILLPEENHSTSDTFWLHAARAVLVAIMSVFVTRFGTDWKLHDVIKAFMLNRKEFIQFLRQCPENNRIIDIIYNEEVGTTTGNIEMELLVQLERIIPAAVHTQQATDWISIDEFMQSDNAVLVIGMDLTERQVSEPIIRAFFRCFVDYCNALPDYPDTRTFVYIDESYFLGKLPGLVELITFGRSKRVLVWIVLQGIEGYLELYREHVAELILGLCRYMILLRSTPKTSQWASSLFGVIDRVEINTSESQGKDGASSSDQIHIYKREQVYNSSFLELPYPNKKDGITGYFITPKTKKPKPRNIPGSVVEALKPKTGGVPQRKRIEPNLQRVLPWTESEKAKYVYGKGTERNETASTASLDDVLTEEVIAIVMDLAERIAQQMKNEQGEGK